LHDNHKLHLEQTIHWLIRSKNKKGGSSAHFNPLTGWSNPYPETTGYIIPTLLDYSHRENYRSARETAFEFGEWLLSIQSDDGSWNGGLHPPDEQNPSVFNTGQILFGIIRLYKETGENRWRESAEKGAEWLAEHINDKGLWETGHYTGFNPTYYTRVAWPMLLVADTTNEVFVKEKAVQVLDRLIERKNKNDTFRGWGFEKDKPAFTHTIAYTLRGFLEASFLLDDWDCYGTKIEPALEKVYKLAELNNGRLAGAYDQEWVPTDYYSCLTGNVQLAICLMRWYEHNGDIRLLNAASKLIEYVSSTQYENTPVKSLNGAVAGSKPIWGRYMMGRYPNWAAKFHADALMKFLNLTEEKEKEWSTAELS
jgi:hypothetical protein